MSATPPQDRPDSVNEASAAPNATDFFEGESDLSDVSDDEDANDDTKEQSKAAAASQEKSETEADDDDDVDDEDDDDDDDNSEDDYDGRPRGSSSKRRLAELAASRRNQAEDDAVDTEADASRADRYQEAEGAYLSADDEEAERRKDVRKKKAEARARPKPKKREVVEEDEGAVDETTARKRMLDARMEAIGKGVKRKRPRKTKDDADDTGVDAIVEQICETMKNAISEDRYANEKGTPALARARILREVQETMQSATLQQAILDSPDFLKTVKMYIDPLRDGSLPSLNVQRAIMDQLSRMDGLDSNILRESGIGKVVSFYSRYERVTPQIRRQAEMLVDKWSKPILNQRNVRGGPNPMHRNGSGGAAVSDDEEDMRDVDEIRANRPSSARKESLLKKIVDSRHNVTEEKKSSRLPNIIGHAYTIAPPPLRKTKSTEDEQAEEWRQREAEKMNRFKRKAMMARSGK